MIIQAFKKTFFSVLDGERKLNSITSQVDKFEVREAKLGGGRVLTFDGCAEVHGITSVNGHRDTSIDERSDWMFSIAIDRA